MTSNMCVLIDTLIRYQEYDDAFAEEVLNHSIHNNDLIRIQKEYAHDTEDDCIISNDLIRIQTEYADTEEDDCIITNPTIKSCLISLFKQENIKTQCDLHKWNGGKKNGMRKLHSRIEQMASHHYNRIKTPKSTISYCSQQLLSGYKIYKEKQ